MLGCKDGIASSFLTPDNIRSYSYIFFRSWRLMLSILMTYSCLCWASSVTSRLCFWLKCWRMPWIWVEVLLFAYFIDPLSQEHLCFVVMEFSFFLGISGWLLKETWWGLRAWIFDTYTHVMKDKMTWTTLFAWADYISGLQWVPRIPLATKDSSSLSLFNHNSKAMKNCKHILKTNFFSLMMFMFLISWMLFKISN